MQTDKKGVGEGPPIGGMFHGTTFDRRYCIRAVLIHFRIVF
jgi:hypothetical protein